jgi:undecaprenyl-diphosphatase
VRGLDLSLFRAINHGPDWLEPVMVFFSEGNKWWWVRVLLLAVLVLLAWRRSTRKPTWLALVSWPFANAACEWLKYGIQMQRPSVEVADAVVRVHRLTSYGTASAHSATMMCIATVFLFYNRPAGFAWLAVALLTGYSRIYVGVHYPSQVLLGWATGAFVGFVAVMTWRSFEALRQRRSEAAASPEAGR